MPKPAPKGKRKPQVPAVSGGKREREDIPAKKGRDKTPAKKGEGKKPAPKGEGKKPAQNIDAFVRSDPMGYVFSYLGAQRQGNLRSSARIFQVAFGAAADAQIHIGRSANKELIYKLEDIGTLPVGSWFPVSEKRCREDPESSKHQQLGTLVVNPRILFNGAQRLPDDFLEGCVAQSIVYAQADHITSVGKRWMANSETLMSANFEDFPALTTVGNCWLDGCPSLTSAAFEGLTALTTVGDCWLDECTSLTSATFEAHQQS